MSITCKIICTGSERHPYHRQTDVRTCTSYNDYILQQCEPCKCCQMYLCTVTVMLVPSKTCLYHCRMTNCPSRKSPPQTYCPKTISLPNTLFSLGPAIPLLALNILSVPQIYILSQLVTFLFDQQK